MKWIDSRWVMNIWMEHEDVRHGLLRIEQDFQFYHIIYKDNGTHNGFEHEDVLHALVFITVSSLYLLYFLGNWRTRRLFVILGWILSFDVCKSKYEQKSKWKFHCNFPSLWRDGIFHLYASTMHVKPYSSYTTIPCKFGLMVKYFKVSIPLLRQIILSNVMWTKISIKQ